jgi:hypothetical protein
MMREGMTLREFEEEFERERVRKGISFGGVIPEVHGGRTELGVVRISLGLGSDWSDLWRVLQWARKIGDSRERKLMWQRWLGSQDIE